MKPFNLQVLEKECREDDIGNITELYSLAEIEATVLTYITAVFCDIPVRDIPNIAADAYPRSGEMLKKQWQAAQMLHRESPSLSEEDAMRASISILQKHVQLQRYRKCKQIYGFDADIAAELLKTQKDINLPYNIFDRLPYQCVFFDYSACSEELKEKVDMEGCLAQVNKTTIESGANFYIISALLFKNNTSTFIRQTILLNSPEEGLQFSFEGDLKSNLDLQDGLNGEIKQAVPSDTANLQMALIIQSLFYLCSYEPDIHETASSKMQYRKAKQNKKKGKNIELPAREFKVGERFGEAFRKWTKGQLGQSSDHTPTGRHNKPHLRRAHWHRHWLGKRDGERQLVVRWHSECFCGVTEDEADGKLDTVRHIVN